MGADFVVSLVMHPEGAEPAWEAAFRKVDSLGEARLLEILDAIDPCGAGPQCRSPFALISNRGTAYRNIM